jgi:hypothetical protein
MVSEKGQLLQFKIEYTLVNINDDLFDTIRNCLSLCNSFKAISSHPHFFVN